MEFEKLNFEKFAGERRERLWSGNAIVRVIGISHKERSTFFCDTSSTKDFFTFVPCLARFTYVPPMVLFLLYFYYIIYYIIYLLLYQ